MARLSFKDPLKDFDWSGLYKRYDSLCEHKFRPNSPHLSALGPDRHATERELYYELVRIFADTGIDTDEEIKNICQAMLYWKLYSSGARNIAKWRETGWPNLRKLIIILRRRLGDKQHDVEQFLDVIDRNRCDGMSGSCALPVRMTLLHFLAPDRDATV